MRSTYEKTVIPENVWEQAEEVVHHGFDNKEYDAVKTFFSYYDIELPSAPFLRPEFSNPLFLKMLCSGLQKKGESRIPRGFHGITMAFDFYLDAVNGDLAKTLDYNPRDNLVREALNEMTEYLIDTGKRWLPRKKAEAIARELLPRQGFSNSLYNGLITEGVLFELMRRPLTIDSEEVVAISYERFADHIIADQLLRRHLDRGEPARTFGEGGELAFLQKDYSYGLIEAMCVQIPEQTGMELATLAPEVRNTFRFAEAFMQSVVWRRLDAFTDDTLAVFNEVIWNRSPSDSTLDSLLTVSTIPSHLFNSESLDRTLRQYSMADRDEWWSTYLHHTYGERGAVDRLLDWALVQVSRNGDSIEDEVVDLSAITLAWMLSTSNRILRDKATKALVSLLSGRLQSAVRLVDRFADVDDPYVTERVYAVAYGVAMRSHDPDGVGELASTVYGQVFASGTPPPHILLRDYARGVVERAIYLGAELDIDESLLRPPYSSEWPDIPTADEIEDLTGAWNDRASSEDGRSAPGWWSIESSVMGGDFDRYVIGEYPRWLTVRLDEDDWQSPEERLAALLANLNPVEKQAYESFAGVERARPLIIQLMDWDEDDNEGKYFEVFSEFVDNSQTQSEGNEEPFNPSQFEEQYSEALQLMMSTLTDEHQAEMETILRDRDDRSYTTKFQFDNRLIQRYILARVIEMGWSPERFGYFDDHSVPYHGREANKPERIGKKYQWIAYYEIRAYISDHYQYRGYGGDQAYEGPWQESFRNIDPSSLHSSVPGGTHWRGHTPAWWGRSSYTDWKEQLSHQEWIALSDDLPLLPDELIVTKCDGTRWVNLKGFMNWHQPHPPDVEPTDVAKRDIWLAFKGYLVKTEAADKFMEWATNVDFWGNWMPDSPNAYPFNMFFGEHGWAPAFGYSDREYYSDHNSEDGVWIRPKKEASIYVQPASFEYRVESGGFDCSIVDGFTLQLPHHRLLKSLGLRWSGQAADYLDGEGNLAAFDPTAHEDGPTALLVRDDLIREYLSNEGLALCWTVLGQRWVIGAMIEREYRGSQKISGAYRYTDQEPEGTLNFKLDIPSDETTT